MAAPETTKFQINYKLADGTLINLYAADVKDLETGLADLGMVSALIKSTAMDLGASASPVATIKAAFPGATPIHPLDDRVNPPAASGPTCAHGAMTFRTGTGAKGPWKGYFCPSPKGTPNQCDPIFQR